MLTVDTACSALRNAHIRLTPQRLLVIDALVGNRTHPTVEQLYDRVRESCPTVSLATVYQTVSLLARQGLIQELNGGPEGVRCDPDTTEHAHAYCERCGGVFDVQLAEPARIPEAELHGFRVTQTELSFYGCCAVCRTIGE